MSVIVAPVRGYMAPYGNGITMGGLGNVQIGQSLGFRVAFRFRAVTSAALNHIHWYDMGVIPGYGAGNLAIARVTLEADSATHTPSGTVLATATDYQCVTTAFATSTFPSPYTVTKGVLYHLVFENVQADPVANWSSVNGSYAGTDIVPRNYSYRDLDFAMEWTYTDHPWSDMPHHAPIVDIAYGDGTVQGNGLIDTRWGREGNVGGEYLLRERFTPSRDVAVDRAGVRIRRVGGTGNLSIRLENAAGSELETVIAPAAAGLPASSKTPDGAALDMSWVHANFTARRVLTSGSEYRLVLSAPSGTQYALYPSRRGTSYGYVSAYADGLAESFDPGTATWTKWDPAYCTNPPDSTPSYNVYSDASLQFYVGG